MRPGGEPHTLQCLHGPPVPRCAGLAAIQQRQFDVLQCAGARQQVEALENEPDVAPAQQGALVLGKARHGMAQETVLARGGHVETTQDIHHGGLAGPGGTHHGHEIAGVDVEIDTTQRPEGVRAVAEYLGQPAHCNQSTHGMDASSPVMIRRPGASPSPETIVQAPSVLPTTTGTSSAAPVAPSA